MRLIDADALKQTAGSYNPIKYTHEYGDVITVADIDNAPTIEAEPIKTGKWIVVSDGYGNGDATAHICECSECKDTIWVYKKATRRWNYCPNTGAKMENT